MRRTWRREEGAAVWSWCQCFCCNLRCYRAAARSTLPVNPLALCCGHEACDLDAGQWKICCSLPYLACLKRQYHEDLGCAVFVWLFSYTILLVFHVFWYIPDKLDAAFVCVYYNVWIEDLLGDWGKAYYAEADDTHKHTHLLPYAYG